MFVSKAKVSAIVELEVLKLPEETRISTNAAAYFG
jgi:hypothetical protein